MAAIDTNGTLARMDNDVPRLAMAVTRDPALADPLRQELLGPKRNQILTWEEVQAAGQILFGRGLSYYGLPPEQWYAKGMRILGRTCAEATPDVTASVMGASVRKIVGTADAVVDLFAGSGNLLLHVARAVEAESVVGIEADPAVYERTVANLAVVGAEAEMRQGDWTSYFASPVAAATVVYVLSPPWGEAFSFAKGLDLARTGPPIQLLLDTIAERDRCGAVYAMVQHTPVEPVYNVPEGVVGAGPGCLVIRIR